MADLAVIYSRISDPSAKSNDPSFEQQEAECRRYCEEHGYAVLAARREAYTGTDLENQALLWDCIDDVKRGRAGVVVANSYDRLSREPQMQEVALYEIEKKYGGRFEAVTEQIDRDDPLREAMRAMLAAAAKVERRKLVQRMRRGKVDRSKRGALYATSNAKFGYRWADDTPGGHSAWLVDEPNAATVRRIFDWFDNGNGAHWIACQLNSEKAITPSRAAESQGHIGNRVLSDTWHRIAVVRTLEDPAYCGRMDAYRTQVSWDYVTNPSTGIMEKKKVVTKRAENDPSRTELECPAIVSVDQWNRVQARLAENKPKEGRPPLDPEAAVMRGHVWCACGRRMYLVRRYDGSYRYRCTARVGSVTEPARQCPYGNHEISAPLVNEFGIRMAVKLAEKKGVLEEFLRNKDQENQPLRQIAQNLAALVERKTAERNKYLEGVGTAKDSTVVQGLVELAEKCAKEIQDAQEKLAKAAKRLDSVDQRRASFDQVIAKVSLITPEGIHDMTSDELRALLYLVGLRVNVSPASAGDRMLAEYTLRDIQTGFTNTTFESAGQ